TIFKLDFREAVRRCCGEREALLNGGVDIGLGPLTGVRPLDHHRAFDKAQAYHPRLGGSQGTIRDHQKSAHKACRKRQEITFAPVSHGKPPRLEILASQLFALPIRLRQSAKSCPKRTSSPSLGRPDSYGS